MLTVVVMVPHNCGFVPPLDFASMSIEQKGKGISRKGIRPVKKWGMVEVGTG